MSPAAASLLLPLRSNGKPAGVANRVANALALYTEPDIIAAVCLTLSRMTGMDKMKALAFCILCFASVLFADDFKAINGKEYKNVTVTRVEADGILVRTKSGISKIYFLELPKDVQEQFHYVDPAKVQAERAEKRARERADKQRKADEILTRTEEKFEAAEMQAAHAYQSSEKGTLSGQVFMATKGGENIKLGAIQVLLFPRDALDDLRAGLSAFVTAKTQQLQVDIAAAEEEEKQASAAEEQARAALHQAEIVRQAVGVAQAALDEASDALAAARRKIGPLSAEVAWYHSVEFYFLHLGPAIHAVETDADGNFTIQIPKTGSFVIAAQAERRVPGETERYYWIQPVSLEGGQQRVLLSNNNVTIRKGRQSLHDE